MVEEKKRRGGRELQNEQAFAVACTNRTPWGDFSILNRLSPERLASILRDARNGECPAEYLELAQDMELRDLHHRSVLSTRKDAACALPVRVVPAGGDRRAAEIAEAVETDIVKNRAASLSRLTRDLLDGLAKGFSACEIVWDTKGSTWRPAAYRWRDPRWFQYDKETGQRLMLRDELTDELHPLAPNKFIIHEPHLVSGTQIAGGLALPALFYFMLKSYDVTSWAAFIDRYGFPIRLAKYGRKATEEDVRTLRRAVASIGADFGAVVPESAQIEIVESKNSSDSAGAYQSIATWIDKQISKLVLGQTMTTDDGSSRAQSQTHEEVRQDIAAADSRAVADTLNAQLVVPYVKFNFGERGRYPELQLYKSDETNVEQVVSAVRDLGPQGLVAKADEVRELLGLSKPDEGDETVGGGAASMAPLDGGKETESGTRVQLNAAENVGGGPGEAEDGLVPISDEIADVLEAAAGRAADFNSLKAELERLASDWPAGKIAELLAAAFFSARADGDAGFEG